MLYGAENFAQVDEEARSGGGIPFSGAKDLARKVAALDSTQTCFLRKSYRFATGTPINEAAVSRAESSMSDERKQQMACESERLSTLLNTHDGSAKALIEAIASSKTLRFRR